MAVTSASGHVAGTGAWRRDNLEQRLKALRVPYVNNSTGRVDLQLKRKDFLESCLAALPKNLKVRTHSWNTKT
jgi:hypothetical protein